MAVAMAVDALAGWPAPLFTRIGHPVTWLGAIIAGLDARWNRTTDAPMVRRVAGLAAALLVIGLAGGLGWVLQASFPTGWSRMVLIGIVAWPFVALRSLHDHVAAVSAPLQVGDLAGARVAVSQIVGRDPATLDEAGVLGCAVRSARHHRLQGDQYA
jgi:adenosylcobinamide-phosphate synthase